MAVLSAFILLTSHFVGVADAAWAGAADAETGIEKGIIPELEGTLAWARNAGRSSNARGYGIVSLEDICICTEIR